MNVTVIGGGASGLSAAIAAAENGAHVTLLERLPRIGKKILLTGNGRCNLGNADRDATRYHGTFPYARTMLSSFDAAAYFRRYGVLTRTDAEGRMYPMSGTASSVLDALRFTAERLHTDIRCEMQVTDLRQSKGKWQVICGEKAVSADAVILAAGGCAAPSCGTDGSLLPLLERMGIPIVKPLPALCPVPTDAALVRSLKGVRVRADVTAFLGDKPLKTESGEVQFAERALSGICVFNLSRLAAMHGNKLTLSLDLLPDLDLRQTREIIDSLLTIRGALPVSELLTGLLPKRVGECAVRAVCGTVSAAAEEALRHRRDRLAQTLHNLRFPVTGTASFSQAQVTAGGIRGDAVTRTLALRKYPGLYVCGELLDVDGDCGGYNLAWAWCSGETAGRRAAGLHNSEFGIRNSE